MAETETLARASPRAKLRTRAVLLKIVKPRSAHKGLMLHASQGGKQQCRVLFMGIRQVSLPHAGINAQDMSCSDPCVSPCGLHTTAPAVFTNCHFAFKCYLCQTSVRQAQGSPVLPLMAHAVLDSGLCKAGDNVSDSVLSAARIPSQTGYGQVALSFSQRHLRG